MLYYLRVATSYNKPPLIELIAELRWDDASIVLPAAGSGVAPTGLKSSRLEELFMQFGAAAAKEGFSRFERVIPPGFPVTPFQVVYRYRPSNATDASKLYQLGNGVFTANALPPYKNWANFRPVIETGLTILREAFQGLNQHPPHFTSAIVRYIDGFRGDMIKGRSTREFLSEALGFEFNLPRVLNNVCTDPKQLVPQLQLSMPVSPGQMVMTLSEGVVDNQPAVIVDTSVIVQRDIAPEPATVVDVLTEARNVIHQVFMETVKKLHDDMDPIEVAE